MAKPDVLDVMAGYHRFGTTNRAAIAGVHTKRETIVFRHSTHERFDMDWGIVTLDNDAVVAVAFRAD